MGERLEQLAGARFELLHRHPVGPRQGRPFSHPMPRRPQMNLPTMSESPAAALECDDAKILVISRQVGPEPGVSISNLPQQGGSASGTGTGCCSICQGFSIAALIGKPQDPFLRLHPQVRNIFIQFPRLETAKVDRVPEAAREVAAKTVAALRREDRPSFRQA